MGTVTWVAGRLARVRLARVQVEDGVVGSTGWERVRPGGLQVHRAGQDQARGGADDAGTEQVADLAGGLLRDELIDLLPGLLRGLAEVGVAHRDRRGGGHRRGEAGLQRQARLDPHRVRRTEGEVAGGQVAEDRRDSLQFLGRLARGWGAVRDVQVQGRGDLRRRLAPGPEQYQAQRGGDAGRGEDQVALARQPAVEIGPEGLVARHRAARHRVAVGRRAARCRVARQRTVTQGPGAPGGPAPRAAPLPSCNRRT